MVFRNDSLREDTVMKTPDYHEQPVTGMANNMPVMRKPFENHRKKRD